MFMFCMICAVSCFSKQLLQNVLYSEDGGRNLIFIPNFCIWFGRHFCFSGFMNISLNWFTTERQRCGFMELLCLQSRYPYH